MKAGIDVSPLNGVFKPVEMINPLQIPQHPAGLWEGAPSPDPLRPEPMRGAAARSKAIAVLGGGRRGGQLFL